MVNYTCEKCMKIFEQKSHYDTHMKRKTPCKPRAVIVKESTNAGMPFKFIDLFCGIGGFHHAMKSLGGECVMACDIDKKCREVYENNFGIKPEEDITKLDETTIPDFDVLCGGFPCQAFSHAGNQEGFNDIRGTLFMDIIRILKHKNPRFFILENVKNLKAHDSGKTWKVIYSNLIDAGYYTYEQPIVASPHQVGIPQHRERVYILGVRSDLVKTIQPFPKLPSKACSIETILTDEEGDKLSKTDIETLNHWEAFIQHFKFTKLPTFPIWSDSWDAADEVGLPKWKQTFIDKNKAFYEEHNKFLKPWLNQARKLSGFTGSKRKLEWQCGNFKEGDSLWNLLFQFRPSGIRVKRPNYSPALVAMAQIVIVGSKQRKLTPREVARLQSFPDSHKLHPSTAVCYKQFGNSVNVEIVKMMAMHLFFGMNL